MYDPASILNYLEQLGRVKKNWSILQGAAKNVLYSAGLHGTTVWPDENKPEM